MSAEEYSLVCDVLVLTGFEPQQKLSPPPPEKRYYPLGHIPKYSHCEMLENC